MAQGLTGPGRYVTSLGGMPQAIAAFKRAPDLMQKLLNHATRATCQAITTKAKARVPVRNSKIPGYAGGALRDAINWELNEKTGIGSVGLTRARKWVSGGRGKPKKNVGSAVFLAGKGGGARGGKTIMPSKYGHLVEFGHGGPHPAPPHPFMIPSAESEKQPYLDRCRAAGRFLEEQMDIGNSTHVGDSITSDLGL